MAEVATGVSAELVARADRPGLAPLWTALAHRLGASDRPVRSVRLMGLQDVHRDALADLLGRATRPASDTTVAVEQICRALRIDDATLRRLVEQLQGPVGNRAAQRSAEQMSRARLWTDVEAAVAGRGLDAWVARLRVAGVPDGDVAAHRQRLEPVLAIVAGLPLDPPAPLAIVAYRHLGDPHALDQGSFAGALLVDAAAVLVGRDPPTSAEQARTALAEVGILADQLSAPVLTLGLRGSGAGPGGGWLDDMADAVEPVMLTASQLRRWPLSAGPGPVHVVENPSVVASAAGLGVDRPLVCTASWPTHAGVLLLDQLRADGASLHYHGDIDPTGLILTEHHRRRFGAHPWRMGAVDYLAAVDEAVVAIEDTTTIPPTPWDPALAEAVRRHRRVVFEEQVVELLLEDLRR